MMGDNGDTGDNDIQKRDEQGFLDSCAEIRKIAFSFKDPLIVHHYDADGLSSGSLVVSAFIEQGKPYRRECVKKLDDAAIDRCLKEKETIFVDLGGGNKRVEELEDVVIIDHHQTEGVSKPQANPMLHGLDGGDELSASGTAFCVFQTHADLGVVGAVGDMQSPLSGMNRWVLDRGVASGQVRIEEDLRLYGRYCRPLAQFLAFSDDPYVPGISYREDKAIELLSDLGIKTRDDKRGEDGKPGKPGHTGSERVYADLGQDEKRAIVSALARTLISANRLRDPTDLIGESYVFPNRPQNETYEANEFSTLLNACGRHSRDDVGVKVCLGDLDAQEDARKLLLQHRRMLRAGIEYASSHVQDFGRFYFLDARGMVEENIIGTVCGMALQQTWAMPILGISLGDGDTLKISGRSGKALVAAGLNLADLMRKAGEDLGGVGGGHSMAAGASIPKEKMNEFLLLAGDFLSK